MARQFQLATRRTITGIAACALACFFATGTLAQTRRQSPPTGLSQGTSSLTAMPDVHFDQKVNTDVPGDLTFRDETGKTVHLKDYYGKKPVLLMMPFFKCAGACTTELNGLMSAISSVKYTLGEDYQVVVVSINPKEGPELASAKKAVYMPMYKHDGSDKAAQGAHFLTGDHTNIRKLADTIGFHYVESLDTEQFAHATGVVVLSPQGRTFRYFYGADYNPRDLKLALTEAGENKVGSAVDQLLVLCYHYDPTTGKYGFLVWRVSQVLGIATVIILASAIGLMLRWEKRHMQAVPPTTPTAPTV